MTNCWIIYNGSLISEKFVDQANLMAEAVKKYDVEPIVLKNCDVLMDLQTELVNRPDFVIFLDKDILLGQFLKQQGIPVFNDPDIIEICDNKAKQYLKLSQGNIPIPKTIIAPKVYRNFSITQTGYFEKVIEQLKLPMIIKEAHGSFGMKVYLIETEQQFYEKVKELSGVDFVFQEFIASSTGRDIRVNIVGDEVVAAMYRHSETDFRANITNGGKAERIELTEEQIKIAKQAALVLGAEYAGVDLLFGENEQPIVCEVNAAAHIRNIYNVTGVNVGEKLTQYILRKLAL
ncbi:SSU ribosomal protein S6P modification protein [Ureibacillus xyleni]|uniref:SSU ribosomal protein S6P modification protein n=1 Tax=Ureibacillus xyleni TaxID=614648 RepID=A0A285S5K0_9BACL|nr:RimK family alpha-L-glutamate ligase [Ureibacillus xyleni]SOC02586.1 SSU ribosomal protein S6P modification protein [Ureibacillus xyleni]